MHRRTTSVPNVALSSKPRRGGRGGRKKFSQEVKFFFNRHTRPPPNPIHQQFYPSETFSTPDPLLCPLTPYYPPNGPQIYLNTPTPLPLPPPSPSPPTPMLRHLHRISVKSCGGSLGYHGPAWPILGPRTSGQLTKFPPQRGHGPPTQLPPL